MSPDPKDMAYISEAESVEDNMVITPVSPDQLDRAVEAVLDVLIDEGNTEYVNAERARIRAVLQAALTEGVIAVPDALAAAKDHLGLVARQLREEQDARAAARARAERAERERDAARAALAEAIECVEAWGAYADDYFKEKWDLAGDLARLRAAAHVVSVEDPE